MKIDYRWWIVISLGILLTISIIVNIVAISSSPSNNTDVKLQEYRDSMLVIRHELVDLKIREQELKGDVYVKEQEISSQKAIIFKLKKRLNEKVDSVSRLDDKHTFLYVTGWLSKRDSLR